MSAINLLVDPKMRANVLRVVNSPELSRKIDRNDLEIARNNLNNGDLTKALVGDHISREAIKNALDPRTEAIVEFCGRPVLQVVNDTYEVHISDEVEQNLEGNRANIEKAIPAVGRIEVKNHPRYDWIGTGFLVAKNVVVTNRHVAIEFARKNGQSIEFLRNPAKNNKKIYARVDIREERSQRDEVEFKVEEVLFIADEDEFDVAFLKVKELASEEEIPLPEPIKLAASIPANGTEVVTIGYPARDSRCPTPIHMERIFGAIYNVKRLAPGIVKSVESGILEHDCTTLGGNSGSVVLNIATGEAVGLHYAGTHRKGNWAVSAVKVAELLALLGLDQ